MLLAVIICCTLLVGCGSSESTVEDIYFTYENGEKIPDGVNIEYSLEDSVISYQLYWKVVTDSDEELEIEFASNNENVLVSKSGLVTFVDKFSTAQIAIRAKDGSGKSDVITLVPVLKGGKIEFE